jgi:hypothetical protein
VRAAPGLLQPVDLTSSLAGHPGGQDCPAQCPNTRPAAEQQRVELDSSTCGETTTAGQPTRTAAAPTPVAAATAQN